MSTQRSNVNNSPRQDPHGSPSGIFLVGSANNAEYWFVGEEVPSFIKNAGTHIVSDTDQPTPPPTPPCVMEQSVPSTSEKPRDNVGNKVRL